MFGLPEDFGTAAGRDGGSADFPVWDQNAPALELFLACQTQWRTLAVAGLGGGAVLRTGLDYAAVGAAAGLAGIDMTPEIFEDLRAMEAAALPLLNRRGG